jgi:hypothetical protein
LVAFALACWPAGRIGIAPGCALWLFQPAVAICILLVAFVGGLAGPLLWPAVVHHAAAAVVLARAAIAPFIEAHQRRSA